MSARSCAATDGGACSRNDASTRDFCAGYEQAAHTELADAHEAEAMREDAAVCMPSLDVDLAFHDPKTRSFRYLGFLALDAPEKWKS